MRRFRKELVIRSRMAKRWLIEGLPFWVCVLGIPFAILEAHLFAENYLNAGCNWPTTFIWAGAACQIFGLWPAAEAFRKAAYLSPRGAISKRCMKWIRDLLAVFLPRRNVTGSAHIILAPMTVSARGNVAVLMVKGDVQQRLEQLERFHRETSERITALEIKFEHTEKSLNTQLESEASEQRAHVTRLRNLFLEFAANNIGWGYTGLVFICVGTILVTFSDRVPGYMCPIF